MAQAKVKTKTAARSKVGANTKAAPSVTSFLVALEHPKKAEVEALRKIILATDRSIREGIKWNAPSFYTVEHFATFNLRAKDRVTLILHLGAAVGKTAKTGIDVEDPEGLLEWLAKDRALVTFHDEAEVRSKRAAFQKVLRAWMTYV